MGFRIDLRGALVAACTMSIVSCGAGSDVAVDREAALSRNVLLITIDTLRADHVGVYGGPVPTPAIDRLAQEGVMVRGFCTPLPSTGPAHVSLLTGLHPWNHGVEGNSVPIEDETLPNVVVRASEAGFSTAAFVSSYVLHERWGFDRGFDQYHFEPDREKEWREDEVGFWNRGEETTDAVMAWLETHHEEPFFVWVHYFDPHRPYSPPPEFRRPVDETISLRGKLFTPTTPSPPELKRLIRSYRGEVVYTDNQVGRLLDGIRRLGVYDDTSIVLTADHGEGLCDHGVLGHGTNLFDELVIVPMIVRAPGLDGGRSLEGAAQLEDLMPTMLSMLGLPKPENIDGVDLLPWILGAADTSPRATVLGRRAFYGTDKTIYFERAWPRKWIGPLDGEGTEYELGADPSEIEGVRAEASARLREALEGKQAPRRERELDDEALEAMKALGYVDS